MRVFDYGEDAAGPFMALEWLPGGTLDDRLAAGALPPAETARIAHGLAAGLAHLHSRGLVHRDLKPANVLFDVEDRPKLGDFGLVRHALGSGTLTEAGTVLGTAAYISPEQASGEPVGPASDVYSFGVVLFRMLTGSLPFVADDALRLIELHRRTSTRGGTAEPGSAVLLRGAHGGFTAKGPGSQAGGRHSPHGHPRPGAEHGPRRAGNGADPRHCPTGGAGGAVDSAHDRCRPRARLPCRSGRPGRLGCRQAALDRAGRSLLNRPGGSNPEEPARRLHGHLACGNGRHAHASDANAHRYHQRNDDQADDDRRNNRPRHDHHADDRPGNDDDDSKHDDS
jgi:serine/threonine protein kinase